VEAGSPETGRRAVSAMPIQVQDTDAGASLLAETPRSPARPERLRVLHVVSHLGMGGTEHGVLKVMSGLGETDFEHGVCAVRGIDTNFASRMKVASQVFAAGRPDLGFQFPLFRLIRIMKTFRPHIVHSRNFGSLEAIPAARLAGVPVTIHSEHGYELDIMAGLPFRRRLLCRVFYSMADAVFTVTRDLRSFQARQSWLRTDKIRVIHNGVDTERFAARPEATAHLRKELAIPADRFVAGSVGRLVPIKSYTTLLRAAEILIRQGRNIHVLLVGSGLELAGLQSYVGASQELCGRVSFPGASDRIPEMLNAMDVFVLPSICEGMSNTILEAMASGLPVVATRAGGNPELVEEGREGWLFTPRDAQALAQHLERLMVDDGQRREFGRAARCRVLERFSLAGMMQRYRDLYFELAARTLGGRN